jgi:putative MATE family efflux protein
MKLSIDSSLGKRIAALAAPVMLAMISQTLINQVDHALIGRLPAEDSIPGQAALFPALVIMWAIGGSLSAISVGTQALTARRVGEESHDRAGQVMWNSLIVAAITSAIGSAAGWVAAPKLMRLMTQNENELRLGVPYLQWRMVGVFSMVTTIAYKSWFDGLGRTRVHMGAAIAMNLINFVLNLVLVFGWWKFPAWGVTGSAIASAIASYIGLFIMIGWSLRAQYRNAYHNYRLSNISRKQQWELIKLSAPSALATIFVMSGFGLFKAIVARLDIQAHHVEPIYGAATWNVIVILMLFFTAFMAYGTATATLVGQSLGAKKADLAERYGWEAVKLGVYFAIVVGGLIALFPDRVLAVLSKNAVVIENARPILRICGALLPFVLSGIVLTQALFGAGNTKFVMLVEFVLHFFCLVPLAWLCGVTLNWGVMGVWMGVFVYVLGLCLIMGWKFAEGRWKEIRI